MLDKVNVIGGVMKRGVWFEKVKFNKYDFTYDKVLDNVKRKMKRKDKCSDDEIENFKLSPRCICRAVVNDYDEDKLVFGELFNDAPPFWLIIHADGDSHINNLSIEWFTNVLDDDGCFIFTKDILFVKHPLIMEKFHLRISSVDDIDYIRILKKQGYSIKIVGNQLYSQ